MLTKTRSFETKKNKYQVVFEQLHKHIITGNFKCGDQLPPEDELAKRFGVSRVTLRTALKRLKDEGILDSQQGSGTFVSSMQKDHYIKSSILFLQVDSDPTEGTNLVMTLCVDRLLNMHGVDLLFAGINTMDLLLDKVPACLHERQVKGIIIDGFISDLHYQALRRYDIPCLVLGDHPISDKIPQVRLGAAKMAEKATEFLIQRYQVPIFMLRKDSRIYYIQQFDSGYRKAIENVGQLCHIEITTPQKSVQCIEKIINSGYSKFGIIATDDLASGIAEAYNKYGITPNQNPILLFGETKFLPPSFVPYVYKIPIQSEADRTSARVAKSILGILEAGEEVIFDEPEVHIFQGTEKVEVKK